MRFFSSKNKFLQKQQEEAIDAIAAQVEKAYVGDGMLVVNRNAYFLEDERFASLLDEIATAEVYRSMAWRLHLLIWAAENALKLSGDFIECGVFRGFSSYFLLRYFEERLADRQFWLFDTYDGIDESQAQLSPIDKAEHEKTRLYDFVCHRFANFHNVNVVKGPVPASFDDLGFDRVAFLHLDMNAYKAELGALEALWDRLVPGGLVVLDDFGHYAHQAQMKHEIPWFSERGHMVLELPTGQGIVIKQADGK